MSSRSAMARSSSSQSSNVSWQPSHEANFHTASLGRCAVTSDLPAIEQPGDAIEAQHGAVLAYEVGNVLAVATHADGALHVALHRHVHALGTEASRGELARD